MAGWEHLLAFQDPRGSQATSVPSGISRSLRDQYSGVGELEDTPEQSLRPKTAH